MPASVTSSPPPRAISLDATQDTRKPARTKKSRVVRRRGRARDGIESDNEIERVVSTDSESDSDESLSTDSATDSESASEDELPDGTAHTPNTSHSPAALEKPAIVNETPSKDFFSAPGDWSEMVADENANGAAELPVIEFSDFKADAVPPSQRPTRKPKKASKKKPHVSSVSSVSTPAPGPQTTPSEPVNSDVAERVDQDKQDDKEPPQRLPSQFKRPVGQSARQAYQQKLESDPSFVPKVGGFWGHDDRLIDKDLRSLSGWWRGRWQGRGRGRGGFAHGSRRHELPASEGGKEENVNLPPIERTWGHDGFEEMKRKEEQRLESQVQRQTNPSLRGGGARGRSGAIATRGGRADFPRGGSANPGSRAAAAAKAGRVWYAMKPELMWTKQSDNFLFYASSKQRAPGTVYRVQLPGSRPHVTREQVLPANSQVPPLNHVAVATASVAGSDIGDNSFVIKLPKRTEEEELPTTVDETPLDDVFKVRPHLVNVEPIPLPAPSNTKTSPPDKPAHRSQPSTSAADPDSAVRSQLELLSLDPPSTDPARWAQTEKAVLRKPAGDALAEVSEPPTSENLPRRPSLPPIQTVYSPPPAQPSPAYPSSYGYPALPPGIALNQHGMPYEISTGRPVYLPAPPPPPMYNPRPVMHSHIPQHSISYMTPPHMHPSSAISPDFIAHQPSSHSHTPPVAVPVNGFIDPATGIPMFALPRSSRVQIRAPGEDPSDPTTNSARQQSISSPRGLSHLRTSSASYNHSPSHPGAEYAYHSYSSSSDLSTLPSYASAPEASAPPEPLPNSTTQPMPHYLPYQQYYYPDPAYGYPQYIDMSQAGQYEMFTSMETHGTTYY